MILLSGAVIDFVGVDVAGVVRVVDDLLNSVFVLLKVVLLNVGVLFVEDVVSLVTVWVTLLTEDLCVVRVVLSLVCSVLSVWWRLVVSVEAARLVRNCSSR